MRRVYCQGNARVGGVQGEECPSYEKKWANGKGKGSNQEGSITLPLQVGLPTPPPPPLENA